MTSKSIAIGVLPVFLLIACSNVSWGQEKEKESKSNATAETDEPTSAESAASDDQDGTVVAFPGPDGLDLHGYLYLPKRAEKSPALIWNHGSERVPGILQRRVISRFFLQRGFVVFQPHRHGQGLSNNVGSYEPDLFRGGGGNAIISQTAVLTMHDRHNKDVLAAVAWLRQQPFVDPERIVMAGCSFGGIQTLLTAEADSGVKAFVAFSPGGLSWPEVPTLGTRFEKVISKAQRPILVLQAMGDRSMEPTRVLGPILAKKGRLNHAIVYPQYGSQTQDNHCGYVLKATQIWGGDVMEFLTKALEQK